ncbi:MAG: cation:proton antiporter [Planctomycetales bacterium]|nr:cation:proton antiporter [Planctomycetales bacterium]
MEEFANIIPALLIVLTAGLLAGAVCKRIGVSLLVGYLVVGALIGEGVLGFVTQEHHELEYLARGGALLMLFAVGIEFSLEELVRLSRYILLGGTVQMLLVAVPLTAIGMALGMSWNAAILVGSSVALSSTVLVFKALAEWGQTASPHGRRAIGILLFQDIALVPLLLLVPLLTQQGESPTFIAYAVLAGKSSVFVAAVLATRAAIGRWFVPALALLRSVELVVLFALCVLGGVCWGAFQLGLPPAVGALAAGIMLSGNRLSKQVDTIVLPFRECFAAIFFVTLGTLLNPRLILEEPLVLTIGLAGVLVLKGAAAAVALKVVGLNWKSSLGMGLGLAQLGEFSFLLLAIGVGQGLIREVDYNRMLFVAMGTLILTPQLLKLGLRWTVGGSQVYDESDHARVGEQDAQQAIVVGLGPIGRRVASRLEIMGVNVCLVDQSPINLHAFAQQGFHTVTGDASDPQVLQRAQAARCDLFVVCVPDDESTSQIVREIRYVNPKAAVVARVRYVGNIDRARKAGADAVISEEAEASSALLRWCEQFVRPSSGGAEVSTS